MDIMIGILIIIATATAGTAIGLELVRGQEKEWEQEKEDKNRCPRCNLPFSEWFWWPGKGDYCWPCYKVTGKFFIRKASK